MKTFLENCNLTLRIFKFYWFQTSFWSMKLINFFQIYRRWWLFRPNWGHGWVEYGGMPLGLPRFDWGWSESSQIRPLKSQFLPIFFFWLYWPLLATIGVGYGMGRCGWKAFSLDAPWHLRSASNNGGFCLDEFQVSLVTVDWGVSDEALKALVNDCHCQGR